MAPQTDIQRLPGALRSRRVRRVLLTTAAAAVVVLVPTACDYAIAADRIPTGPTSGSTQYGNGAPRTSVPAAPGGGGAAPADPAAPASPATPPSAAPGGPTSNPAAPTSSAAAPTGTTAPAATTAPGTTAPGTSAPGTTTSAPAAPPATPPNNGLDVLARDCSNSALEPHTGFQAGNKCVSTAFGEVGAAANNPSLLITDAPEQVAVDQAFTLKVSTRNLIRDRFLGAAAGGYYLESSLLEDGIQRGHFHTACRMLNSTSSAPDPAPAPAFFLATQDNKGGADADVVEIQVPGLKTAGLAQCAVWAGDGSHRIPMMERANQTPAFDVVRIQVG